MTELTPQWLPLELEDDNDIPDVTKVASAPMSADTAEELAKQVSIVLQIDRERAVFLVGESQRLYIDRMRERFSRIRVTERLKRTNPFLLRIRGANRVEDWATFQIQSALYASEEEAVGHLLEAIAKACFPGAAEPTRPDDLDFEVRGPGNIIYGYQVKMSWDCMPMSSRKNLSNTIRRLKEWNKQEGYEFIGYFAPCYGRAKTSKAPGQDYVTLSSKQFWQSVGGGIADYDVKVGEVCALLCSEFRSEVLNSLVPTLLSQLTKAAQPKIGDVNGAIDYEKLFRQVNR